MADINYGSLYGIKLILGVCISSDLAIKLIELGLRVTEGIVYGSLYGV